MKNRQRQLSLCFVLMSAAGLLCGGACSGGAADVTSEAATKSASAAMHGTNATAIPLGEVAVQAEAAFASLHSIEGSLSADQATVEIQQELPGLTQETSARQEENSRILSSSPSLEALRRLDREWQGFRDELAEWRHRLTKRVKQLDEDQGRLAQMEELWEATRSSGPESKMPPEVLEQVERIIAAVKRTREKTEAQQMVVLTLQTRISQQDGRALHELNSIESEREAYLRRLLVRDSPPIWSAELRSDSAQNLTQQSYLSFSRQVQALSGYLERKGGRIVLQVVLFLAIFFGIVGAGRRLRGMGREAAGQTAPILDAPFAAALVLSLMASSWIYPQAPRLLWAIVGAAALIPTALVVRKLIDRRLFPVLNALVVFYFVDQLRMIAASQALLSRALLLAEMLGGALFVGWLLGPGRFGPLLDSNRLWKTLRVGCRAALAVFTLAFVMGGLGYVSLGKLLGHALLQSAYLALILYAVVRIFAGLFLSALSIPPLARSGLVERHHGLLQSRAQWVLEWAAILLWAAYVLEALALRAPVFQDLREILTATWGVGSFKLSLSDLAWFGLTVWAAFIVSQTLRFVLEEEVYPRVHLAPGLHYSISKMVHYAILVLGFFIGVAMLGFDLTRLTILVGAFGVGLGFGLQNIINNFVSGIILLFERPIKVGDVIQLAGNEGVVKRIGIRASIVRIANGSEIIVPNGSLISETVTNWTFSDRLRRIDLPLAVAGPADARQVMELLKGVAVQQPLVLKEPPPQALLVSFAGDSLNFELRFWTNQSEDWSQIRSELTVAIRATLAEHKITAK